MGEERAAIEDDGAPADPLERAVTLAGRARAAEELLGDIRARRDDAICEAIRAGGITTRELGRRCGLTASQVSAIWRRDNPARPRRPPRES
jgi:hypothetical protein